MNLLSAPGPADPVQGPADPPHRPADPAPGPTGASDAGRFPAWWAHAARPARPPLPWTLMIRAALGMGTPLLLGLFLGRLDLGVFAGLGAMHATMNDRVEPTRLRAPRIATALLASSLGMLIGAALQHAGSGPATVGLALTAVAFASGAISATGPRGSASGMLLLVSASLGGGMALPQPWWAAPLMMPVGAGYVVLLGLPHRAHGTFPRSDPRRRALAAAYEALGDTLAALGTPQGAASRQVLTARLNQLQDLLPHARPGRQEPDHVQRLRRMYEAGLAATETASGLLWAWRPVPPAVAALPGQLARAVLGGPQPEYPDWVPDTPALKALDVALRAATDTVAGRPAELGTAPAPPPDPWRLRVRLLSRGSVRYGLRVALCIAVAEATTAALPLNRSYWVPMTVAFVLKPDLGSVFLRAVSRSVGTVLGVAVTAALLLATTDKWALALIASVCVALLPYSAAAHYGLNTAVMTPMALVLVQLGGGSGTAEFWPRVLDTALASVIVLVFGYLLWPERPPHRIEPRLVAAATALREYLASVVESPQAPVAEVWLRRTAYRALADARQEVQQGLTEPPPAGRLAARWLPATAALERLSGAVAAYAAQIRYGDRAPEPAEVQRVFDALDRLTAAARTHHPPTGRAARPTGPHDPSRSAIGRAADELDVLLGH
ncbi:FUSC family protein [Kitasatospora sp. NPDC056138]|uniref:FUSC family protein n=1 Tax=Kitasatospora sp. NPDC056138 TaxID=3345724 RepID=UPI0035D87F52